LLKNLLDGNVPKNLRMLAAAGLVPLPAGEMLQALVRLARDPDPEVAGKAAATLEAMAEQEIISQLQAPECDPEVIGHFTASKSAGILEAIILNPGAPGAAVAGMASGLSAPLLELVLYNRTRIMTSPEILDAIKQNPAATPQILGQVAEIETEFFGSKKQVYTAVEQQPAESQEAAFSESATEVAPEDLILEGLPLDPEGRETAILLRVRNLTVRQKIRLALAGSKEIRAVLIRDANREVVHSVLQSPKITLGEVEGFAAMRSVAEDVLRQISASKTWTRSYALIHNLAQNPKTPVMIAQRVMIRLLTKDLTGISRNRELSEAVRRHAERLLKQRSGN
jgi:hypothetical protein